MSNNSITSFVKDLSIHIININRVLKNIKSNTMADFIYVINKGICYDSKLKGLSNKLTLVLSDTRELDRVPNTK